MGIALKPEHLKRYRDLARLALKYGHSDLLSQTGLNASLAGDGRGNGAAEPKAGELAEALERMGPIYVKLGQMLSSRADRPPRPYLEALSRLQDQLEPFPFTQ